MNGDKIIVETGMIPSNSWYEIRVAFPRIVNPDPTYVSIHEGEGLEQILEIESAYADKKTDAYNLFKSKWIFLVFIVLLYLPSK
jgi:uncharacterized membrane protein